ncbi:hypothetical protein TrVE_jg6170 [Triparma verrucosa]|uniref:Uncharacterized protein n=1 Tax=Triparma verrucosa TaxID=1606542 RepID=A0A9W7BP81_9STRA|nr:hypothetical protein TrVE_jg6170 [Triparma verrucosa]
MSSSRWSQSPIFHPLAPTSADPSSAAQLSLILAPLSGAFVILRLFSSPLKPNFNLFVGWILTGIALTTYNLMVRGNAMMGLFTLSSVFWAWLPLTLNFKHLLAKFTILGDDDVGKYLYNLIVSGLPACVPIFYLTLQSLQCVNSVDLSTTSYYGSCSGVSYPVFSICLFCLGGVVRKVCLQPLSKDVKIKDLINLNFKRSVKAAGCFTTISFLTNVALFTSISDYRGKVTGVQMVQGGVANISLLFALIIELRRVRSEDVRVNESSRNSVHGMGGQGFL